MKDKIILDNLGLIYKAIKELNCIYKNEDEFEQYYYSGLIGLIQASKNYDCTKGESTYLYNSIKNEIKRLFHEKSALKRAGETISLNTTIYGAELSDYISSGYDLEKEILNKVETERLLSTLKESQYKTFLKEYYGIDTPQLNSFEIAQKYGVSHQFVSERIKYALKKLRKEYNEKVNIKNKT